MSSVPAQPRILRMSVEMIDRTDHSSESRNTLDHLHEFHLEAAARKGQSPAVFPLENFTTPNRMLKHSNTASCPLYRASCPMT